ncbi:Bacteriophytochrome cph2 [Jannaschia seosinensis]|uniref:Bacteriophytochrome cph2 n=1 Tax=Jannaschia seosinensis TaxID=313367 RepID=A0A0M7BA35_9RHOB|nr:bifunctional diguanylate cyclase/phosphodiesterase [Jannaschia seosinensis]CUH38296.1 Bacteriophytochrome cph2 [Jannaschia seosinensis]
MRNAIKAALSALTPKGRIAGHRNLASGAGQEAELRRFSLPIPAAGSGALALFDIDGLKQVNHQHDFDTGDRLLDAVGDTLRRALPTGGGLERSEGGRFLIWLPDKCVEEARQPIENLRRLASLTVVEGFRHKVTCSLSTALVTVAPEEGRTRAVLRADALLARAKALGGDRLEVQAQLNIPSLAPPLAEVEAAIASHALEYHVQPIFDLRPETPRAVGVEALLRWNRDDGSILGPAGFMDTLNRIPEAGSAILPECAANAALPFATGEAPLFVTFNITGAVLDGKGSAGCRWLSAVLERVPAKRLVLEIVETAVIVAPERAADLIGRLRAQGVRIALDDFGTGLSNLERLRRFPADFIKMDRAFVAGLGGDGREEAILESMISLARGLGIDLVAEGIETEEQAATLRTLGIHLGQGYGLGRPAPAAEWAERFGRS